MADSLTKTYYDTNSGYKSAGKFHQLLKQLGVKLSLSKVKAWVSKQHAQQLTQPIMRPRVFSTINAYHIRQNYQLDIIVYSRYAYKGYQYILCMVDVYSRRAACVPLTTRKMPVIMEAIKKVFREMGKPEVVNCDNEFNVPEFISYMKEVGARVYFSDPDEINKNAIVERFNGTIAKLLQRWRVGSGRYDWPKVLPELVANYNSTYHKTIHATPDQVWSGAAKNTQVRRFVSPDFKVGDQVRIKRTKRVFDKGDVVTYSKQLYTIRAIKSSRITLTEVESGEDAGSRFKAYELVPAGDVQYLPSPPEDTKEYEEHKRERHTRNTQKAERREGIDTSNIIEHPRVKAKAPGKEWEVEAIVDQTKGTNGRNLYKIRWAGWAPEHDTWQPLPDIKDTTAYARWLRERPSK